MDPYLLPVIGKSEQAASEVSKGCNGFISATPSVVLNWSGTTDQLSFFIYSDADAVLAVQQPDGSFVCNDDAGLRTTDPLVKIANPAPGAYKVYAGTATKDAARAGLPGRHARRTWTMRKLADLDLTSMLRRRERPRLLALPQLDPRPLLTGPRAVFGSTDLQAGFKPVQAFAAGGGDIAAIQHGGPEAGVRRLPQRGAQLQLHLDGRSQGMRLFFEALKDSALAVVTPDQKVLCGMNAATDNLNPVVDIPAPVAGQVQGLRRQHAPDTVVWRQADHHRRPEGEPCRARRDAGRPVSGGKP